MTLNLKNATNMTKCKTNLTIVTQASTQTVVSENLLSLFFWCEMSDWSVSQRAAQKATVLFSQNNVDSGKNFFYLFFFSAKSRILPRSCRTDVTSVSTATMSTTMAGKLVICFPGHKALRDKGNPNYRNNSRLRKSTRNRL